MMDAVVKRLGSVLLRALGSAAVTFTIGHLFCSPTDIAWAAPPQAQAEVGRDNGPEPQGKEAQELWKKWQSGARASGQIPGGVIEPLVRVMKRFVKNNPTHEGAPKFTELVKRINVERDWPRDEAVKLLDEVSTIYPSLPEWVLDENRFTLGGDVVKGKPLPEALNTGPWGEPEPNGLRTAWLLSPRAAEYPRNTPLKSRLLFHNSGKSTVIFQAQTWNQPGGHQALNAKGKPIRLESIMWTTLPTAFACRLAPGEFIEVFAAGVGVGANKNDDDWGDSILDLRIGDWIKVKPGVAVTFVPGPIECRGVDRRLEGEEAPDASLNWWHKFIRDRLRQEAPLPGDPAERARILNRVTNDLFGNTPTADELAVFQADTTPTALDALAKRLVDRPGFVAFTGTLKSGSTKFTVLPVDPDAAKKPRTTRRNGEHPLGGNATFVVQQRPAGERIVNEAYLAFAPAAATKPAPDKYPVALPDDYNSWMAAWLRGGSILWIGHKTSDGKRSIHRIDFSNPAAIHETVITEMKASEQLPQAVLDALQPIPAGPSD